MLLPPLFKPFDLILDAICQFSICVSCVCVFLQSNNGMQMALMDDGKDYNKL
jgi:hypothetical protein